MRIKKRDRFFKCLIFLVIYESNLLNVARNESDFQSGARDLETPGMFFQQSFHKSRVVIRNLLRN